ncbi:MAG TPA: UDP-glucose 4-epimerase GalE, partial [Candidatus Polarisedimenticolia bacterium]|nr:UDP-glucose 4-epimerase GalE [Candidatus Polarisedimenticolia bacterium]
VLEVIEAARRVTGRPIEVRPTPRRPGDPARLVASSARARSELGWSPRTPGLEAILKSAWEERRRRDR